MSYLEGVKVGRETNPWANAISMVNETIAEKRAFDQKLELQARELRSVFEGLGKKHEYDKEIENIKGEQDIEKQRMSGEQDMALEKYKNESDPYNSLIKQSEALKAARETGNTDLVNQLYGKSPLAQQAQGVAQISGLSPKIQTQVESSQPQMSMEGDQYLNEIDPMSGKPTARALRTQETIKNQADVDKERMKTEAGSKKQLDATRLFIRGLERSQEEMEKSIPSIGEKGPVGVGSRLVGKAGSALDQYPKTSAFNKQIKVRANMQSRDVEGGKVTDQDRQIYAEAMANVLENPSEENIILVADSLLSLRSLGGDIDPVLREFEGSNVKLLKDIVKNVRDEINLEEQRMSDIDFSDLSNLSDEYIDKRIMELQGKM